LVSFRHYLSVLSVIVLLSVIINSCKTNEVYPVIPAIEYKSHYFIQNNNAKDSLIVLIFSFKDGDGDIGLGQADTLPPFNSVTDSIGNPINKYYYNLYIDYFEQVNGKMQNVTNPFSSDTLRYSFRVQNLTPEGKHKAIRGEIEVKIEPSPYPSSRDTVMYSLYIFDRALNESNVTVTPPIRWIK